MKTFYSVKYFPFGAYDTSTKWFDNLAEAKAFAKRDYTDGIIVHNLKDPRKIKAIEDGIAFEKQMEIEDAKAYGGEING